MDRFLIIGLTLSNNGQGKSLRISLRRGNIIGESYEGKEKKFGSSVPLGKPKKLLTNIGKKQCMLIFQGEH